VYITERLTVNNVTGTAVAGGTATVFDTDLVAANDFYNGMTLEFTSGPNKARQATILDFVAAAGEISLSQVGAASGVGTGTIFETDLTEANDFYNDLAIRFTSGPNNGETRIIEDYAFANGEITVTLPLQAAPGAADAFIIEPVIEPWIPGADTFIIWTELDITTALRFDLPITSRFCKIVYIGIVQLTAGPMEMNFEIWESSAARLAPDDRNNFYQKILNRRIIQTVDQGGEYGESLSGDPMPYFDRDAVDEESTYMLHCRIENNPTVGYTPSDFAVTIKIADMGENA